MIETVMATEMILNADEVVNTTIPENARSKIVRSFVNLVEILPDGFESKNTIGDLNTFSAMVLWMLVVDDKVIDCIK